MKLSNKLVEKLGADKVLHLFGGGWIVSMFTPFGWIGVLIGFIILLLASFVKELWLDSVFDIKDIAAACVGGAVSTAVYSLFLLFL